MKLKCDFEHSCKYCEEKMRREREFRKTEESIREIKKKYPKSLGLGFVKAKKVKKV